MSSAFTAFVDKFFQDTTLQLQINPFNQLIANFSESACLVDSYFVTYSWINWSLHNCETSFSWTKALGSISSCAFPYFHIQPFCAATCCGLVPATIPIFFRRFTLIFLDFCLDIWRHSIHLQFNLQLLPIDLELDQLIRLPIGLWHIDPSCTWTSLQLFRQFCRWLSWDFWNWSAFPIGIRHLVHWPCRVQASTWIILIPYHHRQFRHLGRHRALLDSAD